MDRFINEIQPITDKETILKIYKKGKIGNKNQNLKARRVISQKMRIESFNTSRILVSSFSESTSLCIFSSSNLSIVIFN